MYKRILLIVMLSVVSVHAVTEANIKKSMDNKVHKVLNILKNNSLSQKQKEKKSIVVMDSLFDYSIMAKISLGRAWGKLTHSQQRQFKHAFERKIKHSYVDKLRLYNNQKVIIKNAKKIKSNRIKIETQVIGNNEIYKVVYLFYKKKNSSQWYIYDVNLVGVSIIQTYRRQFSEFLKTKSFQQLLQSL